MASIAKVITVIGSSPDGFAEAAQVAVTEASKTLRGVSGAQVMSMSCDVTDGKITTF
jgi:flavin-binding protein dodecin